MKSKLLTFLFIITNVVLSAQYSGVFLGVNSPLYYTIGYQQQINHRLSASFQTGFLTKPHDEIILGVMSYFGVEDNVTSSIRDGNPKGFNFQTGFQYHWVDYYFGASYSMLILSAEDYLENILLNITGVDLRLPRNTLLTIHSYIYNAGVLVGRKFKFKNPRFFLNIELGVQKTFYTNSEAKSDTGQEINSLRVTLDEDLDSYLIEYGYLPSLNIHFVYRFFRSQLP